MSLKKEISSLQVHHDVKNILHKIADSIPDPRDIDEYIEGRIEAILRRRERDADMSKTLDVKEHDFPVSPVAVTEHAPTTVVKLTAVEIPEVVTQAAEGKEE